MRRNSRGNATAGVISYVWRHPANRGARVQALARSAAFQFRGRIFGRHTVTRVGKSMSMAVELHSAGASKAVYANPPDFSEMLLWRRVLRPTDLFLDVGSNAGLYSLWAADCGATPVAVEPDPVNAERTRANLKRNGLPIEVHECACAAQPGIMQFTRDNDAMNHLVYNGDKSNHIRDVLAKTLDGIVDGRHFRGAKIDVEGYERLVLQGAQDTLAHDRIDIIQLEWNNLSSIRLGESRLIAGELLLEHDYTICTLSEIGLLEPQIVIPAISESDLFAISSSALTTLIREGIVRA